MHLLVLGGSRFLGRAVVEEGLRRGDRVTWLNRAGGRPAASGWRGEPEAELLGLAGRRFDAVVDTGGEVPREVAAAASLLAPGAGAYAFVSSVSAYRGWPVRPIDEGSPLHEGAADAVEGDYGARKAGCERAVVAACGETALLVRPGLVVGPREDTGRLPWWLRRVSRGGRVLAPGDPAGPLQLVDARDVAAWVLAALDAGLAGPFNLVGEPGAVTLGSCLGACVAATGAGAELVWADDDTLLAHGVAPWTELPLWLPRALGPAAWAVDGGAARAAGFACRPVGETVRDTWAWLAAGDPAPGGAPPGTAPPGIDPVKERRVLAALG